jgi:hypothetical protein
VQVSGGVATEVVTLTNNGGAPVTITTLAINGPRTADFAITADTGELILAVGDSRTVTITYDPLLVGRSGAALIVVTDADAHPFGVGLSGRAVNDAFAAPARAFRLVGSHGVLEVRSQFGTDYTLTRDVDPGDPSPPELFTVPGNGQTLYLTDPGVLDLLARAFYRVRVNRE